MSHYGKRLVTLILLAGVISLLIVGGVFAARKGNIIDEVNYNSVLDGQISVCNQSVGLSDDVLAWGVQQWNEAIGKNIFVVDCTGTWEVTVWDVPNYPDQGWRCPAGAPACGDNPKVQDRTQLGLYVTPVGAGYSLDDQEALAVHELGHNLGFDHWPYSGSCVSIMHSHFCIYDFPTPEPQPVDEQNYYTAYHVDAVSGFAGSSPSPGVVNFTWNPSAIHNEREFTIWRNPSSWQWVGGTGKDGSYLSASGQPEGLQTYCLYPNTLALPEYWGNSACDDVTVQGESGGADLVVTAAPGSTTKNEGGTATFSVTVKNQGTAAAGPFAINVKFNGAYRPYPQGVYAFNNGLAAGAQQTVTTLAVSMNFAGGPMVAVADYLGQVSETSESNNEKAGGTLGVRPETPDKSEGDVVIYPPWNLYAWIDRSNIETGFTVRVQRASSSCSSWSTRKTKSYGASPGTGQQVYDSYTMSHGYCWRFKVRVNGQYANSSYVTSDPYWYP